MNSVNGARFNTLDKGGLDARPQAPVLDAKRLLKQINLNLVGRELGLSGRELEIVRGFFFQETETAAAIRLGLSPHTVHTYVQRVHRKLGSGDRCSAVVRLFVAYLSITESASNRTE